MTFTNKKKALARKPANSRSEWGCTPRLEGLRFTTQGGIFGSRLVDYGGTAGKTAMIEYLKVLGAIDESDPKNLHVIVPNYLASRPNCLQVTGNLRALGPQ